MRADGLMPGVADVFVDVPRGGCHGLRLEFKAGKNKLSSAQVEFKSAEESMGYMCIVCYSTESAVASVKSYLNK